MLRLLSWKNLSSLYKLLKSFSLPNAELVARPCRFHEGRYINFMNWLNYLFLITDDVDERFCSVTVAVDDVCFPLTNALFAGQTKLDPSAACYVKYRLYDKSKDWLWRSSRLSWFLNGVECVQSLCCVAFNTHVWSVNWIRGTKQVMELLVVQTQYCIWCNTIVFDTIQYKSVYDRIQLYLIQYYVALFGTIQYNCI